MSRNLLALLALATFFGASSTGCKVQTDGTPQVKVTDTGEKIAEGAKEAVDKTGDVLSQAGMTGKISSALSSAGELNIENLDVDTVDKTITLRGYVPNREQKKRAEELTKMMAGPEYTVLNDLAVKTVP